MPTSNEEPVELGALFSIPVDGPGDPRPIVQHLVDTVDLFAPLKVGEAVIMVILRNFEKVKQERRILGTMALPEAQGAMREMFTWLLASVCGGMLPDFILTLERSWWAAADERQREALVFHELCHCHHKTDRDGELRFTDDGLPVWGIKGHDVEEFNAVAARYGAWNSGLAAFSDALREGGRN